MNSFPKTLAALKELCREETAEHTASDSAQWAVGDALLEECGVDPVWDEDGITFKGGLKLREAEDWLVEHGMETFDASLLLEFRETARAFPPAAARRMNVTFMACQVDREDPKKSPGFRTACRPARSTAS
jgi:hypothetical protein